MVTRLLPQVALLGKTNYFEDGILLRNHLLFLAPLLFASLATVLQLADESQDVVLPYLKALRVHEPE